MRVLHVLARLDRSGAERMLACSFDRWDAAGIEPAVIGMTHGEQPLAATLAAAGYEVVQAPPLRSRQGLAALTRTIATNRPRLVHIHAESCFDAAAFVAALSSGVGGVVRTVHSNFRFGGTLRARRRLRIAATRPLQLVWVACSQEVADTERSYSAREIHVIENWIDVDAIESGATQEGGVALRHELGIAFDADVLAVVGNCGPAKNHELVAASLEHVVRPIHVLHVGGQGAETEAERAAWLRVPARHTVHHLGGRDDVPRLLAAANLFALPSRYEGLPLAAVEALCARVPVLASEPVRWLADFSSADLLPSDTTAWAQAITAHLERGLDRAAVDAAALVVRQRFEPARGVAAYAQVYEVALAKRRFTSIRRRSVRASEARS
jgi:glycosyltransferase involved in cell wall biosynthesis